MKANSQRIDMVTAEDLASCLRYLGIEARRSGYLEAAAFIQVALLALEDEAHSAPPGLRSGMPLRPS